MNQDFAQEIVKTPQQRVPEASSFSDILGFLRPMTHKVRALFWNRLPSSGAASSGIEHELYAFLRDFATGGVRCEISVTGHSRELRPAVRQQLNLIARKALVNALLHAKATCIETEIEYLPHRLRVVVRDNGLGIEAYQIHSHDHAPLGLSGMRKQAERIGARFTVWSRPGAGTEVEISVPNQVLVDACA